MHPRLKAQIDHLRRLLRAKANFIEYSKISYEIKTYIFSPELRLTPDQLDKHIELTKANIRRTREKWETRHFKYAMMRELDHYQDYYQRVYSLYPNLLVFGEEFTTIPSDSSPGSGEES